MQRIYTQQSTTDSKPDLSNGQHSYNNANTDALHTLFELAKVNKAVTAMGVSEDFSRKIKKLLYETESYQFCLPNGTQFQFFISIPDSISTKIKESLHMFHCSRICFTTLLWYPIPNLQPQVNQ